MKSLLDTCVISEVHHPRGNPKIKAWVNDVPDEHLFLSVLTIGEIWKGIHLLPSGIRKHSLSEWVDETVRNYADRILPIDLETTEIWAAATARNSQTGKILPAVDGLVAATAIRHGLTVVTRNLRHFEMAGAMTMNPWED